MTFHSKMNYLNFLTVTFVAITAVLNPTIVTGLKVLSILAVMLVFYFEMNTFTVTIEHDSIEYTRKFLSFTKSQQLIPVESIEKFEKIRYTMKLHQKNGQNIHFGIYAPDFISKLEEFSAHHSIPIEEKKSKKK